MPEYEFIERFGPTLQAQFVTFLRRPTVNRVPALWALCPPESHDERITMTNTFINSVVSTLRRALFSRLAMIARRFGRHLSGGRGPFSTFWSR